MALAPPRRRSDSPKAEPTKADLRYEQLWSRPGYLVRRLHQVHVTLFLEECRDDNITPVQYGLLSVLASRGALDQITLGREVGIDRTNVADVLTRLETRKLVKRRRATHDKRVKLAEITPLGRELVARLHGAMQRAQDRLLAPLSSADRKRFLELLQFLVDSNNALGRTKLIAG